MALSSDHASPADQPAGGGIDLLTTAEFIAELEAAIVAADERIAMQLMTFDGDTAGLAIAKLLLDAVGRGVEVRLLVDCFALRFVSDRPVTDRAVTAEHDATLAMYANLLAGGVDLRFTNANGPGHIFALARNHKKLYVIDDVAWVGGINVSDHNFEWHDVMFRLTDPTLCGLLLADFDDTAAGRYTSIEADVDGIDGSAVTLLTNRALRPTFDRLIAEARHRIVVASPYALDRRLLRVLDRATAPEKTVVIADHNNFRFLHAITPYLTARAAASGIELVTYDRFSHSKFLLVDDDHLLVGSSNFGRHSLTCNQEVGLVIRDRAFIADFESSLLRDLVTADIGGPLPIRAFGWFATIVMEAYLASYSKVIAPRVPRFGRLPDRG